MRRLKKRKERLTWEVKLDLKKFDGEWTAEQIDAGLADGAMYDQIEREGNLLVIGGASALWQQLIGSGAITAFSNANANLGVGDSTTAAADTQTDLQAATNKFRKAMDATYPQHTDSTGTAGAKTITFRSTFANADAVFAWQEWAVFNAAAAGRMLNRKVESLGTKPSTATWQLTITITLA